MGLTTIGRSPLSATCLLAFMILQQKEKEQKKYLKSSDLLPSKNWKGREEKYAFVWFAQLGF